MKFKHLLVLTIATSAIMISCNSDNDLLVADVASSESKASQKVEKGMSEEEYRAYVNKKIAEAEAKAKITGTKAFTVHGPFTVSSSTQELPGPSGAMNLWKVIITVPPYAAANYFCRYYEHYASISIPSGAYIITDSLKATNNGYKGAAPPNPVTTSVETGIRYQLFTPNTHVFSTHTLVPKYNTLGGTINPTNQALPYHFTSTTFTYYYFTL